MDVLPWDISQLLTEFLSVSIVLAFPLALLFLLYKIYRRLKSIDEELKKH